MRWQYAALEILKSNFRGDSFSTEDAFRILNMKKGYAKGTVDRILHDLRKKGLIERLGRGIYRVPKKIEIKEEVIISDKLEIEFFPGPLKEARKLLIKNGIDFMITGGSVLYRYYHHFPRRLIHLIYVIKGSGELTVILLKENGLRALLNSNFSEIKMALENFEERDIFVIREFSNLLGNINGYASIERALVDLYFESTRRRIPFPEEEVGRIFSKVLRNARINISHLFMVADRRGIKEEMKVLLNFIFPDIPLKMEKKSKHVNKVLMAMKKEVLR